MHDSNAFFNNVLITPASWNANIGNGGTVDFGIMGNSSIGNSIGYVFE